MLQRRTQTSSAEPSRTNALLRVPLAESHPKVNTHMAVQRGKLHKPNLMSDPLSRPGEDASPQEREVYASQVLVMFAPLDASSLRGKAWGEVTCLWQELQLYEADMLQWPAAYPEACTPMQRERVAVRTWLHHWRSRGETVAEVKQSRPLKISADPALAELIRELNEDARRGAEDMEAADGGERVVLQDMEQQVDTAMVAALECSDAARKTTQREAAERFAQAAVSGMNSSVPVPVLRPGEVVPAPTLLNFTSDDLARLRKMSSAATVPRSIVDRASEGTVTGAKRLICTPEGLQVTLVDAAGVDGDVTLVSGDPPYVRMAVPPTPCHAAEDVWRLSPSQRTAFRELAEVLLLEKRADALDAAMGPVGALAPRPQQVLFWLQGEPGTGKSQVYKAVLWFAWQHDYSSAIAVVSYQWRAAHMIGTDANPGCSTTTFFKVADSEGSGRRGRPRSSHQARDIVQQNLRSVRLILEDEMSFGNCGHVQDVSMACVGAIKPMVPKHPRFTSDAQPYAGLHYGKAGDIYQHDPITPHATYFNEDSMVCSPDGKDRGHCKKDAPCSKCAHSRKGRRVMLQFTSVHVLREQHRIDLRTATQSAKDLYHLSRLFMHGCQDERTMARAVDMLQARALLFRERRADMLNNPLPLRAVVSRCEVRDKVHTELAMAHARVLGRKFVTWKSTDYIASSNNTQPVPPRLVAKISALMASKPPRETGDIAAGGSFYEGQPGVFVDNEDTASGRMRNARCESVALVLHEDEESIEDDSSFLRELTHTPRAVFVRPLDVPGGRSLGDVYGLGMPALEGCLMVEVKRSNKFSIKLPAAVEVSGAKIEKVDFKREGIPLGSGLAVTDYYAQGMTFSDGRWLMDLRVPPTGQFRRPTLFVTTTRPRDMDGVWPLAPLWDPASPHADRDRRVVIRKYMELATINENLKVELQRLNRRAAQHTRDLEARWSS